jgi:hypothetical protein
MGEKSKCFIGEDSIYKDVINIYYCGNHLNVYGDDGKASQINFLCITISNTY